MNPTIHGIRTCTTMRKAMAWLDAHSIGYHFHDYRSAGVPRGRLMAWIGEAGFEALLNRAGPTFRRLPEYDRQGLDAAKALALMLEHPSLIRRPVLELPQGRILIGFRPAEYAAALGPGA